MNGNKLLSSVVLGLFMVALAAMAQGDVIEPTPMESGGGVYEQKSGELPVPATATPEGTTSEGIWRDSGAADVNSSIWKPGVPVETGALRAVVEEPWMKGYGND